MPMEKLWGSGQPAAVTGQGTSAGAAGAAGAATALASLRQQLQGGRAKFAQLVDQRLLELGQRPAEGLKFGADPAGQLVIKGSAGQDSALAGPLVADTELRETLATLDALGSLVAASGRR